ncbi:MAG: hypothetical protein K6U04_13255 [Armatimonadetes bacterium]|nr:hypothetical protein [Armatimonadota bacterium]
MQERKKKIFPEQGQALILVMLVLLVLALLGAASLTLTGTHGRTARYQRDLMQAYYTAEAGVERALIKIRENPSWNSEVFSRVPYAGGEINEVRLTKTSAGIVTRAEINSVGKFGTAQKTLEVKALVYSVSDLLKGASILPGEPLNLRLTGNLSLSGEQGSVGVIFAVGGNLEVSGSSEIQADVYASGSITGRDKITGSAYPYYQYIPPFPALDELYYKDEAQRTGWYYSGNRNFNGGAYSGIYFVDGTLTISGTYSGKAIFVARSIEIDGDLKANTPNDLLTLISFSDVDIKNHEVKALIIAAGAFRAQGNAILRGGLLAQNMDVSGNVNIYCNPALAAQNPPPGFSFGSGGVKIESWREQFPVVSWHHFQSHDGIVRGGMNGHSAAGGRGRVFSCG